MVEIIKVTGKSKKDTLEQAIKITMEKMGIKGNFKDLLFEDLVNHMPIERVMEMATHIIANEEVRQRNE
jgi:hypothetical protein